jgi:hypothetical protein
MIAALRFNQQDDGDRTQEKMQSHDKISDLTDRVVKIVLIGHRSRVYE